MDWLALFMAALASAGSGPVLIDLPIPEPAFNARLSEALPASSSGSLRAVECASAKECRLLAPWWHTDAEGTRAHRRELFLHDATAAHELFEALLVKERTAPSPDTGETVHFKLVKFSASPTQETLLACVRLTKGEEVTLEQCTFFRDAGV